jgi:DtxR family Mn-dependent transcriptional regulator
MSRPPLSEAIQDYLKGIYKLQDSGGRATVTALARDQDVSPASASAMLKKLAVLGLLEHEPYRGARLTPDGAKVALEVIRHHRLIEAYLAEALGMPHDRVHEEAEVLEHYISEELEQLIAAKLGEPSHDPHGTPIPGPDLLPPTAETEPR